MGYSSIVRRRVLPALKKIKKLKFEICSKSSRQQYIGESNWYRDYREALDSSDSEIVYISLPNSKHFKWAKKALLEGFHVIIDKPATTNLKETLELIKIAKMAIPEGKFQVGEANKLLFSSTEFDIIFSHSVFHYFPNHQYVDEVLALLCTQIKSGGKLLLLDLNDANMEDTYHSDRMREYNSPADYAKTYKNLSHLFFDKQSLSQRLETLGMWKIEFFSHAASDYGNSKFRFNLICTKA